MIRRVVVLFVAVALVVAVAYPLLRCGVFGELLGYLSGGAR